ncbi:extracellular solute-binding protein [Microbacterium sp. zg.B48]|uniref:ABC transporter substrate-binding protein n=1 Tax=Microbacterium sp. zg-B185 TaxID=3049070 RepID=UPI00214B7F62|nr:MULTISPECIES: extracellular solute-binding protein [unclassified Microbacterium]MCR2762644.1 extracellular solute-binding protein [Microbacterium sp. zg.B48]MCR2808202.1 extracellular solute-binding protein [Microbacterium sp. zg.B185]WIM20941.1 extracellular solute-binding protein [Microbacterium sp. zg-B185]
MSACSGDSGPAEVRFHLSKPEAIPYFRELIGEYNASQDDVRVVFDNSSNLQAGFLRGDPPDLGLLNYNMEMARFMERGALSDLSDMPEAERILPEVQDLVDQYATYPGRTSVLPYSVMAASVIYNKQIFAEQGLEVPQTWDQLIEVCEALTAAGITPFYATFKDPWTVGQGWFDYTVGGAIDVADFYAQMNELGTEVGPDSPVSFQKTLSEPVERMTELTGQYINEDAASRGYGDGNLAFAQGEAAMYLQGPWAFGEIAKTDPDMDLGTFPLPMTDDPQDNQVRVNIDLAAWIPEASEHKEAARDFLSFLFQKEVMDEYNAAFLGYGTTTDAAPVTDPRIVEMKEYYDDARFYQGASKAIPLTIPTDNYIQGIVTGSDVDRTLAVMDADWARLALRQ